MADQQETDVVYSVVANFAALTAAIAKTRADLAALEAQEAAFNESSVKGSQKSTQALKDKTKAIEESAKMTEAEASATEKSLSNTIKETAATNEAAKAKKLATAAANDEAKASSFLSGVLGGLGTALSNLTGRHKESTKTSDEQAKSLEKLRGAAIATGTAVDQLNKVLAVITGASTTGAGPAIALPFLIAIPAVAGLIALLDPLVALLGAIGGAAIGLGSNLASLAGTALAIIPGISALISVFGALKLAMNGIGGAFTAAAALAKATGGGGGGGGGQTAAQQLQALTVAQQGYTNSIQAVTAAQTTLDAARVTAIRNLENLQTAVNQAQASSLTAAANLQLATENYYKVLADPASTKGQKEKALADLTNAQNALAQVQVTNTRNQQDLTKAQAEGVSGNPQVIAAQNSLTRAIQSQATAQYNLSQVNQRAAAGGAGAASAANSYAAALANLSPSAQTFVTTLLAMKAAWGGLQQIVQENFFSQFVGDLERINSLLGPLTTFFGDAATSLGKLADNFLLLVTSAKWLSDFSVISAINVKIIDAWGAGLLSVIDAFKNLSIIAGPFAVELSNGLAAAADNFDKIVSTARDNGSLANWLETIRHRLSVWWDIVKNVAMTLFNFGTAAGSFGQWITDGLDKITKNWLKVSEDSRRSDSPFKKWLEDIKPLLSDLRGLIGDIFKSFAQTSSNKSFITQAISLVDTLRKGLGPALSSLLSTLGETGIGTTVVKAISDVIVALSSILKSGGAQAISDFVNIFVGFFDFLAKVAGNPIIGPFVGKISELAASLLAISLIGRFTGVLGLLGRIDEMAKSEKVISFLAGLSGITVPAAVEPGIPGVLTKGTRVVTPSGEITTVTGKEAKASVKAAAAATKVAEEAAAADAAVIAASASRKAAIGGVAKLGVIGAVIAGTADAVYNDVGTISNVITAGQKPGATPGSVIAGAAKDGGVAKATSPILGIASDVIGVFSPDAKKAIDKWLEDISKTVLKWALDLPKQVQKNLTKFWDAIPKILPWLAQREIDFDKWFFGLPVSLAKSLKTFWTDTVPDIKVWLESQADKLVKWAKRLAFVAGVAAGNFWNGLTGIVPWLVERLHDLVMWLGALPGQVVKTAVNIWNSLPGILAWLAAKGVELIGWLLSLPGLVSKHGPNIWDSFAGIGAWLAARGKEILDWVVSLPGKVARLGINLLSGLGGAFNLGFTSTKRGSADGGLVTGFASGGKVIDGKTGALRDAGTDTVPTMLTPGEYVLRKSIVDMLGVARLDRLNNGGASFTGNGMNFFSGGGLVASPSLSTGRLGMSSGAAAMSPGNTWNFGNINIYNPVPETSSDSLPSALRKVAYMSNGRRQPQAILGTN